MGLCRLTLDGARFPNRGPGVHLPTRDAPGPSPSGRAVTLPRMNEGQQTLSLLADMAELGLVGVWIPGDEVHTHGYFGAYEIPGAARHVGCAVVVAAAVSHQDARALGRAHG